MRSTTNDMPAGYWLGRYALAETVHVVRSGPYEGPVCGCRSRRLWSLIDDDRPRDLCRACARWLRASQTHAPAIPSDEPAKREAHDGPHETNPMDHDERQDGQDIRLRRDNEADLLVEGAKLLAEVSSRGRAGCSDDRWTELRLWASRAGKLVAEQVGRSAIKGERDRCRAWVCHDHADVIRYLRRGWLARELYEAAEIDDTEVVG